MPNQYMERCSASLVMRKMQIKTTMGYHFTPVRMSIIKNKNQKISLSEDVEKLNPLYTDYGNRKWYSSYGKWFLKIFKL
jgi:hypothetical protein